MKLFLQIVLAIIVLFALVMLLSAAFGYLIQIAIVTAIVAVVIALVRAWWVKRQERLHPIKSDRKAEKDAHKTLKQMERQAEAERTKP
jgi:membrane associated rhomboid family serine protease